MWWRVVPALVTAVALQVAVNYANDFSDGVRGTDRADLRKGPARLVGSGLVSPARVKNAAFISSGVAGIAGLVLAYAAGWWLLVLGAVCVLAAWSYTGGPWPYGYAGLGEVAVFVFFGAVATIGTSYVLTERVDALAAAVSIPVGLWSVALLTVNNLRDIDNDKIAGKHTLAVRLGDRGTGILYTAVLTASYAVAAATAAVSGRAAWAALTGAPLAVHAVITLRRANSPGAFADVLAATSRLQNRLRGMLGRRARSHRLTDSFTPV